MMAAVPVVKMNGTHNEFVVVDARVTPLNDPVDFARRICDRDAGGIGADGLLLLLASAQADARLRIINADGSEAEMCGNGMRCVARYLDEHDGRETAVVETIAGPISTNVISREPYTVSEILGTPVIGTPHEVAGFTATPVDVGNPHVVIFVDDLEAIDELTLGPRIERDPRYPHGTNVHFVQIVGDALRVVHWERGAGATAACGTGAVSCAAVAIAERGFTSPVRLYVPGGELRVSLTLGQPATLIGDAVTEFATTFV
jgi:diaminopimelate epimerase